MASGLILAPITLPILPVETFIGYSQALHLPAVTSEGHEMAELQPVLRRMFGWPEKAAAVAEVYASLPPEEKAQAVIFGHNYGRAGAIDFFGPELGLPRRSARTTNYWIWGPGEATGEVMIFLGGNRDDLESRFQSVEEMDGRAVTTAWSTSGICRSSSVGGSGFRSKSFAACSLVRVDSRRPHRSRGLTHSAG